MNALRWLYRFADRTRGIGWNPRSSADPHWNLGRTRALLDLAGAPDRALAVVLIAGTKGKGSTAAFLATILAQDGIRAGLYTGPHLQEFRERIRVDGVAISEAALEAGVQRFRPLVRKLRQRHPEAGEPTTFELTTALALDYFARRRCRVAIVEVGLGGRLDATNALSPLISIITPISLDHTAILGRTLRTIAQQKAGIMRVGRPTFSARQRPSALAELRRQAREVKAEWRVVAPLPATTALGLAGRHQLQNAALARAAAHALGASGIRVDDRAIRRGLAATWWPGRFERVAGRPPVILDGAHNGESAKALASALREDLHGAKVQLVFGTLADKDVEGMLRALRPRIERVWVTAPHGSRALAVAELARRCRSLLTVPIESRASVQEAIAAARRASSSPICVTGSLALVGEARAALGLPWPRTLERPRGRGN